MDKIDEWINKYPLLTQAFFPAVVVLAAMGTLGLAMFTISVALI